MVPKKRFGARDSFSAANASAATVNVGYVRLNIQTPSAVSQATARQVPPRGDVQLTKPVVGGFSAANSRIDFGDGDGRDRTALTPVVMAVCE